MGQDWDAAWAEALDDLEVSVDAAERVLHGDADPVPAWYPPLMSAPIPDRMVERAQALLRRQVDVAEQLAAASLGTRRQLGVVSRVSAATRATPGPAFLDVSA